jgi:hypothetical protein
MLEYLHHLLYGNRKTRAEDGERCNPEERLCDSGNIEVRVCCGKKPKPCLPLRRAQSPMRPAQGNNRILESRIEECRHFGTGKFGSARRRFAVARSLLRLNSEPGFKRRFIYDILGRA